MSKVFRVEKTRDFTVISNHHLKNKELSLKAKGLLTIMLSLPDEWDYTMEGLVNLSHDKITSIRSTINELEDAGYVKKSRVRKPNGQYGPANYTIYEYPIAPSDGPKPTKKSDEDKTNTEHSDEHSISDKPISAAPVSAEPVLAEPISDEPISENPILAEPMQEKHRQLNTYISNTNLSNTDKSNTYDIKYPSINHIGGNETNESAEMPDRGMDGYDKYKRAVEQVKEQIDYETLVLTNSKGVVDDIVNNIAEVYVSDRPTYKINGEDVEGWLVKSVFRDITYERVEAFLLDVEQLKTKIGSKRKYLRTALYNIPFTSGISMANRVNCDMYGITA